MRNSLNTVIKHNKLERRSMAYALFSQYTHKIPRDPSDTLQKGKLPLYFFRAQENSVPFVKVEESYLSTTFVAIEASKVMDYISLNTVEEREPPHKECVKALQDPPNLYAINLEGRELFTLEKDLIIWVFRNPGKSLAEFYNQHRESELYPEYSFNEQKNKLEIKSPQFNPDDLKVPDDFKDPHSLKLSDLLNLELI